MIVLKNVTKRFGDQVAVNNLSMELQTGELCVFVGESGCGKSTTLKMINRLIENDEGSIEINGKNINSYDPVELRKSIGYVVQSTGLFPHMTVYENIAVVPRLLKWKEDKIQERAKELIQLVGGEAQRIGVARALAANPEIILMDEPFGAVDPLNRTNLQNEFLKIQKQLKKTVIFVTHDIEEAMKMGDKIAIMSKGKLECFDTPEHVLSSANTFVKSFLGTETYIKILSRYNVKDYMRPEKEMEVSARIHVEENLREALAVMLENGTEVIGVTKDNELDGVLYLNDVIALFKERQSADEEE